MNQIKLVSALENENHLRRISNVIQTRHRLIIPTVTGHCGATWIEEGEQIAETESSFGQIVLGAYKMGTLILASDELLEDSGADIEKLILEQFAQRIGKCEEEAFLTGDGNHKPTGLPVGSVSAGSRRFVCGRCAGPVFFRWARVSGECRVVYVRRRSSHTSQS